MCAGPKWVTAHSQCSGNRKYYATNTVLYFFHIETTGNTEIPLVVEMIIFEQIMVDEVRDENVVFTSDQSITKEKRNDICWH